jgi:hypothetical protein
MQLLLLITTYQREGNTEKKKSTDREINDLGRVTLQVQALKFCGTLLKTQNFLNI